MSAFPPAVTVSTALSARHFFPKFDNLHATEADPVDVLTDQDVLLLTKKHSGSLILLYGVYVQPAQGPGRWELVANSKNGTNNEFSIAAEHYFRAQFAAVFGADAERKLLEFAGFMGRHGFTFCFEFVTAFLGDHGERPNMPYAVLTSITQFDDATLQSRFASLPEMVSLACTYKLILNEMWVVSSQAARGVSEELRAMRWTGEDKDFTSFLDARAVFKIHSMLPHAVGQGQLLEGLVVQVCRTSTDILRGLQEQSACMMVHQTTLVVALKDFGRRMDANTAPLTSFCPPDSAGPVSDVQAFLAEHSQGNSPISQLFNFFKDASSQLRFISLKSVQRGDNISIIIHVHKDQIFFGYAKNKPEGASHLYRGMEVFIQRSLPAVEEVGGLGGLTYVAPSYSWQMLGISKWKNWQYLKRTFGMRNQLPALFRSGFEAYMTNVLRQFQNWGLPRQFHESNRALLAAWGKWLLEQKGAKKEFMTNSHTFGYLQYVDIFLPLYQSGALDELVMDESEKKNIVIFVLCFAEERPAWLGEVLSGYVKKEKHRPSKTTPYQPGVAYFLDGRLPKNSDTCKCPYFVIVVPPTDTCIDRRALGMYESFQFAAGDMARCPPIAEIQHETQAPGVLEELTTFERAHTPKRVFLLTLAGLPPGSGKSTLAAALLTTLESSGLRGSVVSSDHYGMIHGAATGMAREAFETAVVTALTSGLDVVIYDKNIPNMQGIERMRSVASRAALPKLTIVPIVPRAITQDDIDLFLQRVLSRAPGSHTLTVDTQVPGYEDAVEDFVSDMFAKPCMDFVPVAQLLPGAIVLEDMFATGTEASNASIVVEQLLNWDSRTTHVCGINLASGDYLGLCFELDASTRDYFQEKIGAHVRELVHATIVYYRGNSARMAEAARMLKNIDTNVPVVLNMTRLGFIRSSAGILAWGSLTIPGFESEPMHATLVAEGFKAVLAREGEESFDRGVITVEGEELVIQKIDIEPVEFEAWWSVC